MRNLSTSSLHRFGSKRAVLAFGGVAAIGLGIVNSVGTQAATQDAGTANVSQIATQNYYAVPVATNMNCSTSGTAGINRRANLSWTSAGPGVKYSVEQWKDNSSYKWSTTVTSPSYSGFYSGYIGSDRVRIYSINISTNEKSTGYISASVYSPLGYDSYCTSTFGQENVTSWQQQSTWTPDAPALRSGPAVERRIAPITTESTTSSTGTTPSNSSTPQPTTSSSTTTPSTGTTTAPKTTAPATSAPTTTTTTTAPTTATTPSTTTSSTTTSSTAAN